MINVVWHVVCLSFYLTNCKRGSNSNVGFAFRVFFLFLGSRATKSICYQTYFQ